MEIFKKFLYIDFFVKISIFRVKFSEFFKFSLYFIPMFLQTSPKELNNPRRTWDLDAIVSEIDAAKKFIDIHVMDYFPLFIYRNPRVHFSNIDDAIRRAVVRGVKIRFLAAALHYPDIGTRFLRSLESLNGFHANGTMEVVSYFNFQKIEKISWVLVKNWRKTDEIEGIYQWSALATIFI